jgi:hypothetical protein
VRVVVPPYVHGDQPADRRTKRAVVEEALQEYVMRRKQLRVLELFGTIDYDEDYDDKAQRSRG